MKEFSRGASASGARIAVADVDGEEFEESPGCRLPCLADQSQGNEGQFGAIQFCNGPLQNWIFGQVAHCGPGYGNAIYLIVRRSLSRIT
jgi:hypothetical protein